VADPPVESCVCQAIWYPWPHPATRHRAPEGDTPLKGLTTGTRSSPRSEALQGRLIKITIRIKININLTNQLSKASSKFG
jgi:hypothetical protein